MELVDGDSKSPTLISNVEVMQLLKKNLEERAKQNSKRKINKRIAQQFRHRDWVEGEVFQYLKSTPCVKLDPDKREEFYSKLKGNKKLRRPNEPSNTATAGSKTTGDEEDGEKQQSSSAGYDLTEAEALQIMNMMPSEPVEIHLMVDELQSRMSEERQEEFLSFIKEYSTGSAEAASIAEPMEEDDVPSQILTNGGYENGKKPAALKKEMSDASTGII